VPENLFSMSKEERRGKKFHAVVEIGDAFPADARGARVVSAWLETGGEKIPAGLRIPSALWPANLQKGQQYRCRLLVDRTGFLEVESLEKE